MSHASIHHTPIHLCMLPSIHPHFHPSTLTLCCQQPALREVEEGGMWGSLWPNIPSLSLKLTQGQELSGIAPISEQQGPQSESFRNGLGRGSLERVQWEQGCLAGTCRSGFGLFLGHIQQNSGLTHGSLMEFGRTYGMTGSNLSPPYTKQMPSVLHCLVLHCLGPHCYCVFPY